MSFVAQAGATTGLLFAASLISKIVFDPHADASRSAYELLRQALHARDLAAQDADATLRLQHSTQAATLMQAARTLARDVDLERLSGIDVSRLSRSLETRVMEARQICAPPVATRRE